MTVRRIKPWVFAACLIPLGLLVGAAFTGGLTANPIEDIANVAQRAGVMVNGRWIPETQIQDRLADIAIFYGN